ncbi:response regulator containing a CheY-like receiver domain and a GGDEF domain transmembrane protein [Herbaspirillum seropedicae SmR1]|uniref:diguanylate cyclase n=2 Tax=Herbaspirillum seropedicae TaxID=964 RepID=D8IQ03_HERSS|nr:response regulator containing a CheY-like receiver domain and a GGDEF domain transmembrane protein [Herbaspirillum seropedicae SmR1]
MRTGVKCAFGDINMAQHGKTHTSRTALLFVVVVCVVILLLEAWTAWRAREVALSESTTDASNVALALIQHAEQSIKEADIVLETVQEHLDHEDRSASARIRTHDFMIRSVASLPQLAQLTVVDEQGRTVASSQQRMVQTGSPVQDDYFQYHQHRRSDRPFIGQPMRSHVTGQRTLTVSRRINHVDGSFAGVIVAEIDLAYFQRYYEQFNIGPHGVILFGLTGGSLILRRPLLADMTDRSPAMSEALRKHMEQARRGSFAMRSERDGVERISCFQQGEAYPIFTVVALAKDDILEDWSRHVWVRGIGVVLLLAVICFGGKRLVVLVAGRERAEAQAIAARQELESLYRTLEAQSQKDGLTDVFNRRYFDAALAAELARLNRTGESLSLMMIDVDHFKQFNDTYGHAAGDVCLRQVAAAISTVARRQGDIVARYGGEEFAVILPNCHPGSAQGLAHRVVQAVRGLEIAHERSPMGVVTISVGVASLASGKSLLIEPRELIDSADGALYRAKEEGRDRAVQRPFASAAAPAQKATEDAAKSSLQAASGAPSDYLTVR